MPVDYSKINSLEDIQLFANSDFTLYFKFQEPDGNPFNLTGATVVWVLSPFGMENTNTVLQFDGTITDAAQGECTVEISSAFTEGMSGRFIQQPVIMMDDKIYRPAQGMIYFSPEIVVTG